MLQCVHWPRRVWMIFPIYRVFQKFVPIVNCTLRKAFNASLGKCKLIQVRNYLNNLSKHIQTKLWRNYNIFEVLPQMCMNASFFPAIFFLPILYVFFFSFFFPFSFIFCTLSRKWRPALFVLTLRHLFSRSSGHSVTEIAKLLNKSQRYKWTSGEKWRLEKTNQGVDGRFFLSKCVRNVIEKAVSICVIILQDRKLKKFNFTISKFRAQR